MKTKLLTGLIAVGLLMSGMTLLAQNGPGPGGGKGKGKGYGGPPQSQEERAARQADCLQTNGGICPNGGPRTNCPADCNGLGQGKGKGQGKGQGQGNQRGKRDGTGPRHGGNL